MKRNFEKKFCKFQIEIGKILEKFQILQQNATGLDSQTWTVTSENEKLSQSEIFSNSSKFRTFRFFRFSVIL